MFASQPANECCARRRGSGSTGLVSLSFPFRRGVSCIVPAYICEAIDSLLVRGAPVIGLLSPLTARGNVGYVGLDSFKVGRTAA